MYENCIVDFLLNMCICHMYTINRQMVAVTIRHMPPTLLTVVYHPLGIPRWHSLELYSGKFDHWI